MKIGIELIKLLVIVVVFFAVSWLFNVIWGEGDGGTTRDAIGAVIAGSVFYIIFHMVPCFYAKWKRNRRT